MYALREGNQYALEGNVLFVCFCCNISIFDASCRTSALNGSFAFPDFIPLQRAFQSD